uniref:Aminopeptidase O-like isoform X1 n=1 Tax=Castor canadensis TaxID=51338 RepID=A0A8B7U6E6_CASCN|nr:aminopeptidase O-like isoform X1 [Castor canadensis]
MMEGYAFSQACLAPGFGVNSPGAAPVLVHVVLSFPSALLVSPSHLMPVHSGSSFIQSVGPVSLHSLQLLPDQLVLLLEHLLEEKTLRPRTLQSLQRTYCLHEQDAEVRHRWCELIIKHKFTEAYEQVERFLQEDQAMGVYLYGELMVSEDARQQQLARRCFELAKEQMDRFSAQVVAEMLF